MIKMKYRPRTILEFKKIRERDNSPTNNDFQTFETKISVNNKITTEVNRYRPK